MKAAGTIARIREALGHRAIGCEQKSDRRVYIDITPDSVTESARLMFSAIGARLQIATSGDTGKDIEVMYHWALDREDCVVTVRVRTPRDRPELASIAELCPAAEWIEREIWELLGVEFTGHPDLRHLLLADDWPQGRYPLRKDDRPTPGGDP